MAATQAESQQNEVNRDQVQPDQSTDLSHAVLQNGTEKGSGRGLIGSDNIVNTKARPPGQSNLAIEMSQYRQESGTGPPIHNSSVHSETSVNSAGLDSGKLNSDSKIFQNSEQSVSDQSYRKGSDPSGQGYSLGFSARGNYHSEQHGAGNPVQNSADNNLHNNPFSQFNPQSMRHGFPGSKPIPGGPMVPPRPPSGGSNMNANSGFPPHVPQQRFLSGQSISQQTGPTPTLNQLLQSPNAAHRYQNSYGDFPNAMQKSSEQSSPNVTYNQSWPPQRPVASYGAQVPPGYRNQPPGNAPRITQPGYLSGQGSPPVPTGYSPQQQPQSNQYGAYPQRYPAPGGRQPFSPQQMGPYGQQQQQQPPPQQSMYGAEQRVGWNQHSVGSLQSSPQQPPTVSQASTQSQPQPHSQSQLQTQSQLQIQSQTQTQTQPQSQTQPPPQPPHQIQSQAQTQTPPQTQTQSQPQPSPQPQHPPHSPGQPQHQQSSFPSRPQQPPTPTHAPDTAELTGQNSNDSSTGPAPGTPNSQGMRPTPSPTGSTGSRSMSPAVGQQNIPMPPRPSSGQSDGNGPARLSHSPVANQGPYQQPLGPPPHLHGYKMGSGPHPPVQPQQQLQPPQQQQQQQQQPQQPNQPPFSPQGQQYSQGNYAPRPQAQLSNMQYGPSIGGTQPPQSNNVSPGPAGQYPARPLPNHVPHSQFGGYQGWNAPNMSQGPPPNVMPGKTPVSQSNTSPQSGPRPHTPPHYLKQHLQQMGYGGGPSPTPGLPPGMGPPHSSMGPPTVEQGSHHPSMGPPSSIASAPSNVPVSLTATSRTPLSNSHLMHDGPMPPPSAASNSQHMMATVTHESATTTDLGHENGGPGGSNVGISVTSVVTTGPDGAPVDEASQQSTLSNASAASGEDPSCTPKSRKEGSLVGPYHSHPATPQSTVPSPGAASMTSMHEDYGDMNSPTGWPRTPASPVFNSHVHQDPYRVKKPDSLGKLYEMDDSHERRVWLDKLLQFMEERGTPISACPTISKNPLDLFRLYLYVKERGGFMEVTKNKTWKDIAGLLGIGASSSAAYTLRKHYTKNLLAFECHFDRGGIDPQPIINQVEASSKKKGSKAAPVPSPGSSNSQDSFPTAGSGSGSMDNYPYGGPDYGSSPMQRPPSQTNAPSPHSGAGVPNQAAGDNVSVANPFEDVPSHLQRSGPNSFGPSRSQGLQQGGYSQYPDQYNRGQDYQQFPPNSNYAPTRPMYPPYGPESDRTYNQSGANGRPATNTQDPYGRGGYVGPTPTQPPGYPQRYPVPPSSGPPSQQQTGPPAGYPSQQEYYPPDQQQVYPNQQPGGQMYPGGPPPPKSMPPPGSAQRRHPDFDKGQQPPYPPYSQQRPPMYGGWSNNNSQYRAQFPTPPGSAPGVNQGTQQWTPRTVGPPNSQQMGSQWGQPNQQSQQQWVPSMANQSVCPSSSLRQPLGPRPFRPEGKAFPIPIPSSPKVNNQPPSTPSTSFSQAAPLKREIVFPPDSVESTTPVLYKRKRLTRSDVAPVEAWRLMMSLRSGLLGESTWALDILNILLFDDSTIAYFGLAHMPGLLDVLLEHFRRSLADMFDMDLASTDQKWYQRPKKDAGDVDLGSVKETFDPNDRVVVLESCNNYTLATRKGDPVKVMNKECDIFVVDSRKIWDVHGDVSEDSVGVEVESDPWQLTSADFSSTSYIVPCFQGELGIVPFVRQLRGKKKSSEENADHDSELERTCESSDTLNIDDVSIKESASVGDDKKNKKRTRLSDVLQRIKKEPLEMNDVLAREIREKVEKIETVSHVKKEGETDSDSIIQNTTSHEKNEIGEDSISVNMECVKVDDIKMENVDPSEIETETESCAKEDDSESTSDLRIKDPAGTLKRRRMSDYEDECYTRDEASLYLVTETQDSIARRCVCLSNILRNLTFVPGNELEFTKNATFLGLLGKLLLLHHEHPARTQKQRNYDREEDADFADSCSSLQGESEWWWDFLHHIRENVLVMAANISGHMDLGQYPEEISRPVLDGLLHWAVCPAAHGQDPFPTVGTNSWLSPQRLALEALCKLCVTDSNVDLVIATPPHSRLERLCAVLTRLLCRSEEQVLREFAVNLLHYLAAADSSMARTVALQSPCVSLLVAFIEQAEASALGVASQHGIGALRENPDSMGTSLDMLRRAAGTLLHLARHPGNRPLFLQQEQRLLALVMSQILDQQVASIIARVLFQCSRPQQESFSNNS